MYKIRKINKKLEEYLKKRQLLKKWTKIELLLEDNISHPSLNFEKIILKRTIFYSFRLDKKYRGICIIHKREIEVIVFTNHYK